VFRVLFWVCGIFDSVLSPDIYAEHPSNFYKNTTSRLLGTSGQGGKGTWEQEDKGTRLQGYKGNPITLYYIVGGQHKNLIFISQFFIYLFIMYNSQTNTGVQTYGFHPLPQTNEELDESVSNHQAHAKTETARLVHLIAKKATSVESLQLDLEGANKASKYALDKFNTNNTELTTAENRKTEYRLNIQQFLDDLEFAQHKMETLIKLSAELGVVSEEHSNVLDTLTRKLETEKHQLVDLEKFIDMKKTQVDQDMESYTTTLNPISKITAELDETQQTLEQCKQSHKTHVAIILKQTKNQLNYMVSKRLDRLRQLLVNDPRDWTGAFGGDRDPDDDLTYEEGKKACELLDTVLDGIGMAGAVAVEEEPEVANKKEKKILRELVKEEGGIDQFNGDKKKQKGILAKMNEQPGVEVDMAWIKRQLRKIGSA